MPPPGSEGTDLGSLPTLDPSTAPRVELAVRPRASFWDRAKIFLLFAGLWWVLVWAATVNNPIETFGDAVSHELTSLLWLEVLAGVELLRQFHYLISEHSPKWHRFFTNTLFGGINRFVAGHMSDWTRFRAGRAVKWLFWLVILAVVLAGFFHTSPVVSLFQVPAAFVTALPLIVQVVFFMLIGVMQFVAIFWFMSKGGIETYFPGDIKTRFSDVWGQDSVLARVKENVIYLRDPESIEARGGYVPGGILLWGPPGTGKTLIAEAVAGETHNPFVFVEPSAFQAMFFGVGPLKVRALFRKVRKLALRYGGVVVFFDEADSLGNRGALAPGGLFPGRFSPAPDTFDHGMCNGMSYLSSPSANDLLQAHLQHGTVDADEAPRRLVNRVMAGGMMGGGGMGVLQPLLAQMSGLKKPRGFFNRVIRRALGMQQKPAPKYRILFMMATNMPDSLDEALLRPGRIDRIYKVGYPSKAGRIRTYEGYFSKVANSLTPDDLDRLATITPYATGASIKDLVNESLINSIREGRDVITWSDVVRAKQLKDLGPPEDVEYVERERHAVAVHEACHALAATRLRHSMLIDIATIEKGGSYLGMVSSVRAEDTFTQWRSDYEVDVIVSLASLAGEKIFFEGDNSSGVSGDLNSATIIATYMEGYWGMGQTVASHGITQSVGIGGAPVRDRRRDERGLLEGRGLGERIESKLMDLLQRTAKLIEANRTEILALAHALERHKTLTGEDVMAIVNGTKGPLIDGRMYHTEEFREMAEAYHAEILRAHRDHDDVNIPLPVLPDYVEPLASVGQNGAGSAFGVGEGEPGEH
ncbi:MAG TPA: AAA family ATPase [Acidimicrobiales bacterium]|nr:AAA family ATPase [Acidimicrobiales bacterium]